MLKYVKRHWDETRGDQHNGWGTSWWYFEVTDDGWVTRQVEQYDSGVLLHYDLKHDVDPHGGLASEPLDLSASAYLEIPSPEFEELWELALKAGS
jgi:hypothetical protein